MELYGVHHGGDYHFGGITLARMKVEPAAEMLEAIDGLPKGSVVGVESVHPEELVDDTENLSFDEDDLNYWQTIAETCEDAGASVAYLDSLNIHKRAAQRRIDLRGLASAIYSGDFVTVLGQERTLAEIMYSLEAQISYYHNIAREDSLIRSLEDIRPQMAILGLAHADYIMLTQQLIDRLGISDYYKALIDAPELTMGSLPLFSAEREVSQFLEQSPPSEAVLKERELTIRTYTAATAGRIAVGKEATWIGSWEPSNRPYGLFEVYPAGQTEGIIEDRIGSARYIGDFDDGKVEFIKKYDPDKILDPSAYPHEVFYKADRISEDEFEGSWHVPGMGGGAFIIRKGSYLYDPPDTEFGQQKLFWPG